MAAEFASMLARLNVGEATARSWIWVFAVATGRPIVWPEMVRERPDARVLT